VLLQGMGEEQCMRGGDGDRINMRTYKFILHQNREMNLRCWQRVTRR